MKGKIKECDNLINCDFPKTPTKQWETKTKSFNHHICVVKLLSSSQNLIHGNTWNITNSSQLKENFFKSSKKSHSIVPLLLVGESNIVKNFNGKKQEGKKCFTLLTTLNTFPAWRGPVSVSRCCWEACSALNEINLQ